MIFILDKRTAPLRGAGIATRKPTCLKKAWVNSADADGLWKTKTGQTHKICERNHIGSRIK